MRRVLALIFFLVVSSVAFPFLLGGISSNPTLTSAWSPTTLTNAQYIIESWNNVTVADTDKVTSWVDRGSIARDYAKLSDGTRPTRVLNQQNGKPAIRFTRAARTGLTNSPSAFRSDGPWTTLIVAKFQAVTDYDTFFLIGDAAGTQPLAFSVSNDVNYRDLYFWSPVGGYVNFKAPFATPTAAPFKLLVQYNGLGKGTLSNLSVKVNGSSVVLTSVTAGGSSTNKNAIGHYQPGEQYCSTIDFYAAYGGTATWDASELSNLDAYVSRELDI